MQNQQSKTPYKFKNSYGGTPEPQTPQDAPWLRGPSLKIDLLIICKIYISLISITRARGAHARWSLQLGTTAVGSVTLPPLVLASLPLAWDQRTKSPTEEHHPMPCWPCRAAAASMQLVAMLGRSSCVSPQLQL